MQFKEFEAVPEIHGKSRTAKGVQLYLYNNLLISQKAFAGLLALFWQKLIALSRPNLPIAINVFAFCHPN